MKDDNRFLDVAFIVIIMIFVITWIAIFDSSPDEKIERPCYEEVKE